MSDVLRILAVLGLVGANAFFVIGEYAVVTARRGPIAALAERGRAGARAALRLMDDPVRVISTVQVGITAVGILTGAVGEPLVRDVLGEQLPQWAGFVLAFGIVTYLSVVLGELVPKALTLDRAERLAVVVAPAVALMAAALRPVVWLLQASAQSLLRPFGIRDVVAGETIRSPEELRALVDEAEGAGVIPRAQEEMLHNVFEFAAHEARDVMIHAADVAWLDAKQPVGAALGEATRRAHTRFPVGRGSLDRVVGVAHLRDLVVSARADPEQAVETVSRPVAIVPESKDLGALLRELREQRQQLAVIADEYGRTIGIVTLEDILEEIVGEIEDEYDLPDDTLTQLDDGTILVAGSMTVDDFNETVGTTLPQDGPHTLAGLVFDALGRRPDVGETVRVGDIEFAVGEIDGARIARLRVSGVQAPPAT
ncbi:MAG: hemolysin family protein [Thermoleophilia bacterium]